MVKKTYLKKDLIDYVGSIESPDENYYNRQGWIEYNLPRDAKIQRWIQNGYQGKLCFVIRLDGYIWLFNDYYGSCSGCDAFMSNEEKYIDDMFRSAYCFPNEEAALEYIKSTDDYSWEGVRSPAEEMIRDYMVGLINPKSRIEICDGEEREMTVTVEYEK